MDKNNIRKFVKWFGIMMLAVFCFSKNAYAAKPSEEKVMKAYQRYYDKHYVRKGYSGLLRNYYDINKDGIKEMYVSYEAGVRGAYDFFTYHKGKVIRLNKTFYGCNDLNYMRGKKYRKCIAIQASQGASESFYTVYRIKGKKMIEVARYTIIFSGYSAGSKVKYYKNGKRISKKTYNKFENKLIYF